MKKIFLLLFFFTGIESFAQINGAGFYRVQNFKTGRTLFVQDDKASVVLQAGTADVSAIVPWTDDGKPSVSNAQSVIYIEPNGDGYNLISQGMNTYSKIQMPINISKYGNTDTYNCYATKSGTTLYLCDEESDLSSSRGQLGTNAPGNDAAYRRWYITPINSGTANYFGVKPTVEIGGKYYTSFYAGFSFKVLSANLKVYVVTQVSGSNAVLEDKTNSQIPAGTPVIFESTSNDPSQNKIELLGVGGSPLSTSLTGIYFCNGPKYVDSHSHKNITVYDPATMRVLGKTSDGKLGLIKTSEKQYFVEGKQNGAAVLCIPENTAILKGSGLVDEIILNVGSTAIDDIKSESTMQDVYSLLGTKVGTFSNDVNLSDVLSKGIYVVNGRKIIIK